MAEELFNILDKLYTFFLNLPQWLKVIVTLIAVVFVFKSVKFIFKLIFVIIALLAIWFFVKDFFN